MTNQPLESLQRALRIGVALNLAYAILELVVGYWVDALALISDSTHNLSDVLSLVFSLIGFRLIKLRATKQMTYGFGRSTILIALFNALLLLMAMGAIAYEAIDRILDPVAVPGFFVAAVAGVGIVINTISAGLLFKHQKQDVNAESAYLHLAADAAVSVAVVASGLLMQWVSWPWLDGAISLVVAVAVVIATWGLLKESLRLSLDGVPDGIDPDAIKGKMESVPGVLEVHHLHIWALSSQENGLTAHVVTSHTNVHDMASTKAELKRLLFELGITHPTLEFQYLGEDDPE